MFAHQQQSGRVVNLSIDQDDGCDGRIAHRMARLQLGICLDLAVQIGRGIEKYPALGVD